MANFPGPEEVLVEGLVTTLLAGSLDLGGSADLEGSTLEGVLVGFGVGVLEGGRLEDLGLHRLLPRFFLAMPWWLGICLAKWFGWIETARVWEGAKEQRRTASVESAKMLRSLMAGISSKGRQRE
jgi:hypothetical protein